MSSCMQQAIQPLNETQRTVDTALYDCRVKSIAPPRDAIIAIKPCPACGCESARPTFAVEGLTADVVVCQDCGLGMLHPMPSSDEIASFYPKEYYGDTGAKFEPLVEMMVRVVASRHARFLVRGLPAGARVLDIGCGRGVLLSTLADRGLEVHGVEHNETAIEGADSRAEIRIAPRLSEAAYPEDFFDEVIIWHVLEHLAEPRQTIEEIHRILRPGGRLVVAVPNFSSMQSRWAKAAWFHLDLPRHLFHFSMPALRSLLKLCNFNVVSEHHFSLRQNPFGWVQSFLNRSKSLPRNGLYMLLQKGTLGHTTDFSAMTRLKLRVAYLLGMPIATILSVVAATLGNGATIHVVATAQKDGSSVD